jgi:hypothetical protein
MVLVGLVWLHPGVASAQPSRSFERGWIDLNVGGAWAGQDNFVSSATNSLFLERATFGSDYKLPRGADFDFGGGVMITPFIGVGVAFSGTAHKDAALLSAQIPHPLYFNAFANDTAPTNQQLERTEGGVNLQAMAVVAQTERMRVRVFGGPTYFRVTQDVVDDIVYDQSFGILTTANSVHITSYDSHQAETNGWGFHAGGDVAVFFNRIVGLGAFARFSRGTVDIENGLAGGSNTIKIKTGGLQTGGGLRLKF